MIIVQRTAAADMVARTNQAIEHKKVMAESMARRRSAWFLNDALKQIQSVSNDGRFCFDYEGRWYRRLTENDYSFLATSLAEKGFIVGSYYSYDRSEYHTRNASFSISWGT